MSMYCFTLPSQNAMMSSQYCAQIAEPASEVSGLPSSDASRLASDAIAPAAPP
jgi:hypothetical protein